jgi:hypothetical protein
VVAAAFEGRRVMDCNQDPAVNYTDPITAISKQGRSDLRVYIVETSATTQCGNEVSELRP